MNNNQLPTLVRALMKKMAFLKYVGLAICILLLMVSAAQNQAVTVAFGGDTLFGGYYQSSDPQFGTMDALAQMIDRYVGDYGEGEDKEMQRDGDVVKTIKKL